MSEPAQAPAMVPVMVPAAAPPAVPPEPAQHPGIFGRLTEPFHHDAQHAGPVVLAEDVRAAIKDHAGIVFDVGGDVLALAGLIDPADAGAIAAAEALAAKVFEMVGSAARIAGAVHQA